jgi:tetratricopeptide (TPR) repeat protein
MKETIELFRQDGRWNEGNLSQLVRCTDFNQLDQRTIQLVGELIPMHQFSHPSRGIGQGTLSGYYTWLSDAHSHLKQTEKAVDAAAAAIVSWGPAHSQRRYATRKLNAVIDNAEDLDDYVTLINKRASDTGQDSSIIRRSIGKAYSNRREDKKAITQLQIAIELQPGDLDTHHLLMTAYDNLKDKAGAVRQLLALIDVDRPNLSHYVEIEKRLRDDADLTERAATAVVEASPNEAEYHGALARIRTAKKQHAAAVIHWEQVAEMRSLEPNGLINLARAQIQAHQPAAAVKTIAQLQNTTWPSRFESKVRDSLRELRRLKLAPGQD